MEVNKIIQGDCLEEMDKLIEQGVIVDAIITDPPYGTTACKWDSVIPFEPMWERLNKLIKPNGAIVLFGSEPFSSALRMSNIKNYKYDLIWDKVSGKDFYQAKKRPLKQHENISVFSNGKINYNPQMIQTEKKNMRDRVKNNTKKQKNTIYGDLKEYTSKKDEKLRYPGSIFKHSYQANELHYSKRVHQTQKPVALMEYLIKTYTNKNELVLDFTAGSGSTLVACKNLNRNFIGIELDEKYCEIARQRLRQQTLI